MYNISVIIVILVALRFHLSNQECTTDADCENEGTCEMPECRCNLDYIGSVCNATWTLVVEVSSSTPERDDEVIFTANVESPNKPTLTMVAPGNVSVKLTTTAVTSPYTFLHVIESVSFDDRGEYDFEAVTVYEKVEHTLPTRIAIGYVLTVSISTAKNVVYFEKGKMSAMLRAQVNVDGDLTNVNVNVIKNEITTPLKFEGGAIVYNLADPITLADNGSYLFTAIETYESKSRERKETIEVIVEVPANVPKINDSLEKGTVRRGESLMLTCEEPDGIPVSVINWIKNNSSVSTSASDPIYQQNGMLVFTPSTPFDANGTYTCVASNSLTSTNTAYTKTSSILIIVQGEPEFVTPLTTQTKKEKIEFSCTFDAFPLSDINWTWEENDVNNLKEQIVTTVTYEEGKYYRQTSKLIINHSVLCLGRGTISCFATNDINQEKNSVYEFQINQDDYDVYKDSYIVFPDESKSFEEASEYCNGAGGYLVDIRSSIDQEKVTEFADSFSITDFYIGYKYELNSMWKWRNNITNNPSVIYTNWENNNNPQSGCASNVKNSEWSWNASNCEIPKKFACKLQASEFPSNLAASADACDGTKAKAVWVADRHFMQSVTLSPATETIAIQSNETEEITLNSLSPETDYTIKVETGANTCKFKPYEEVTFKTVYAKALEPDVTVNASTCYVSWTYPDERKTEVQHFNLKVSEKPVSDTNGESTVLTNIETPSYTHSIETKPYSIYSIEIQTQSCIGNSNTVTRTCTTLPDAPDLSSTKVVTQPPNSIDAGQGIPITITPVTQRNGPIECLFVVLRWRASGVEFANFQIKDTGYGKIKQEKDELSENEDYFAFAVENKSQNLTLGIGEDITSCQAQNSKKRSISVPNKTVTASNRPLKSGATYQFYVIAVIKDASGFLISNSPWSSSIQVFEQSKPLNTTAIIVPIVVVLLLILIFVIVFLLWRRKQDKENQNEETSTSNTPNAHVNTAFEENIYENASKDTSIAAENLRSTYQSKHADENRLFREEYRALATEVSELSINYSYALSVEVRNKNRFTNIHPANESRVVLRREGTDVYSDYINASYLDGYRHPRKFIAAQGPLPNTVGDFWYMVWDQESSVIVMLTKVDESGKRKCEQYWPEDGEECTFDNLIVKSISSVIYGPIVKRTFQLTNLNQSEKRLLVTQFHYLTWPDHGVPITTSALFNLRRLVFESQENNPSPIVVHCSAGVGRTGTFVVFDYLCQQIERESRVDIYGTVLATRRKRKEMVQTVEQYGFLHKLMLEKHLFRFSDMRTSEFESANGSRIYEDVDFEQSFYNLTIVFPFTAVPCEPESVFDAIRDSSALSYQHSRLTIRMRPSEEKPRFINASYVQTYSSNESFIACQAPLKSGIEDFWRVVLDNNVTIIVMLSELNEKDEEHCSQYWPENQEIPSTFGDITVSLISTTPGNQFTERWLKVDEKVLHLRRSLTVLQMQYEQWPNASVPTDAVGILGIISKTQANRKVNQGNTAPVLVHCRDGSARTGTFCAIVNLIERLKTEDRIDIFRTVKDLRDMRLQMVRTLEQYRFCWQAVQEYLDSFQLYANFK